MRRRFVPLLISALVAAVCGGAIIAAVTSLPAAKPPVNENAGSGSSDSVPPGVVFTDPPVGSSRSDTAAPPAGGPATASVDPSPSESSPYKPGATFAAPPAGSSDPDDR
jgi:hypothetical protein